MVTNFFKKRLSSKGEAMWWIIIGAVLALIVLIVMVVMFTSKGNGIKQGLDSCTGICTDPQAKCPVGTQSSSAFTCSSSGSCCIGFAKTCANDEDCNKENNEHCGTIDKKQYCIEKSN